MLVDINEEYNEVLEKYKEILLELSGFEYSDDYHAEEYDYYNQRKIDLIAAKESIESDYPEFVESISDDFGMPY